MLDIKSKVSPGDNPGIRTGLRNALPLVIAFLIFGEFVVDSQTPLGFSDWMSYIVPILLTGWTRKPWTRIVTCIVSILTVAGIFLSPPNPTCGIGVSINRTIINRTIGITVFWIAAVLVILRRNALEKLQLAHIELENRAKQILIVEKLKAEFLADTSHELRTPLAIVKSYLDLALGKKSQKVTDPRRVLREINKEVEHISQVVSDITLLARSDAEFRFTLHPSTFSFQKLVARVIEKHKILAKNKNIAVAAKFSPQFNYNGDEEKLEKLFTNLLTNAIQYGREGGWINISILKDDRWITVEMEDNGVGIPPKDLPHIFERFYRVEKARTRDAGGAGLGLAICKWIAEAHQGSISVSSVYGRGSIFTVKLPVRGAVKSNSGLRVHQEFSRDKLTQN